METFEVTLGVYKAILMLNKKKGWIVGMLPGCMNITDNKQVEIYSQFINEVVNALKFLNERVE